MKNDDYFSEDDDHFSEDQVESLATHLKLTGQQRTPQVLITLNQYLHHVGRHENALKTLDKLLDGRPLPEYPWPSLSERKKRWAWLRKPIIENFLLITLLGIFLSLLGLDNQMVQTLSIIAIAFTILPPILFPPKDS